jgi:hypothetical protein
MRSGIYIFPSFSKDNIFKAVNAKTWAVPIQSRKASIVGKANSMAIGDLVLLYLTGDKDLYGMLRVSRLPDTNRVVSDIWEGNYELPFGIELCHTKMKSIHAPSLMHMLPSLKKMSGPWSNYITKFRGITIFQKQMFSEDDIDYLQHEYAK